MTSIAVSTNHAVVYMRCSGLGQVSGDTWERQLESCRHCASSKSLTIIHEYSEKAVPGKFDEESRPAFQEMVSELLGNGCRTIIVESLDRLAREYRIQEQLIIYLASKGLTLISANTGEDITAAMMGDPMRRALVQIQGIFAELDKNLLVAKLRKARQRKRTQGKKVEGRKAFGELPGEQEILQFMVGQHQCGVRVEDIAERLNFNHFPTRSGRPWRASVIRKILKRQVA